MQFELFADEDRELLRPAARRLDPLRPQAGDDLRALHRFGDGIAQLRDDVGGVPAGASRPNQPTAL